MDDSQNPGGDGGAGGEAQADAILSKFGDPQQLKAAAAQLDTNTVKVSPSGATFPTISAALASITDASLRKQYLITAGPGTYNEQVILKPYVYLHGSGTDQTVVTYGPFASDNFLNRGTIVAASNSGVANLTANCLGGTWGAYSTALMAFNCTPFLAGEVVLLCDDQGNAGINIETIAVNSNAPAYGPTMVYFSHSTASANMTSGDSVGQALIADTQARVECMESKLVATGGSQSFGVNSNGGASVTLDDCYVQGATFALNIPDYTSTLIANNCTIDGPVQNGVQINNDPPPSGGA
ncbi:MAG: hypothetical protein ABW208_06595 [Pyrinomonadaceae bacterium]